MSKNSMILLYDTNTLYELYKEWAKGMMFFMLNATLSRYYRHRDEVVENNIDLKVLKKLECH